MQEKGRTKNGRTVGEIGDEKERLRKGERGKKKGRGERKGGKEWGRGENREGREKRRE